MCLFILYHNLFLQWDLSIYLSFICQLFLLMFLSICLFVCPSLFSQLFQSLFLIYFLSYCINYFCLQTKPDYDPFLQFLGSQKEQSSLFWRLSHVRTLSTETMKTPLMNVKYTSPHRKLTISANIFSLKKYQYLFIITQVHM